MKKHVIPLSIIILNFSIAVFFYFKLPLSMATHWGISGNADGYSSRIFGTFLLPLISLLLFLILTFLPSIDPYSKNFKSFERHYLRFISSFLAFMTYLYSLTIIWNLGYRFHMIQLLIPAFSFLFFMCGDLIMQTKRNWFVGIRTPWTLSDELVWEKTHHLVGRLFKYGSIISLLGVLFPYLSIYFILIPVIFTSAFSLIYSYYLYSKNKKI